MKEHQSKEEWEEEFDEKLSDFLWEVTKGGAEIDSVDRYPSVRREAEKFKSFIKDLLTSKEAEIRGKVEGMKGKYGWAADHDVGIAMDEKYDEALSAVISLLDQNKEER